MAFKTVGTARSLREIGQIESALKRTPDNKTIRINTPGVNQATRVLSVMTDTLTALQAAGAKVSQAKVFSTAFGMAGMDTEAFDKYAEADNTPTATYSKAKGVGGVVNAQAVSLLNEYADGLRNLGTSERKIKSLMTGLGDMANFLTTDTKSARALETALLDAAGIKSEFQQEAKTVSEIARAQKQVGADATTANSLWQKGIMQVNRSYEDITAKIAQVDAYLNSGNYLKAASGIQSVQKQITSAARAAEDMQERIKGYTVGTTNASVISTATTAASDIGARSAKNTSFFNSEVERLNIALDALNKRLAAAKAEESEFAAAARRAADALKKQRAEANSAANNFFRFRAILALVVSAFYMFTGALKSWFDMASEYAETNHLLYATLVNDLGVFDEENGRALRATDLFGRKIQSTQKLTDESASAIEGIVGELDKLSDRLQVDPTNLKKTYATFYEMANSANMASDKVNEVAKGMTQLTYDVGSLWDEDFESVAKKMRSALGGITTSVRMFGIDISRTAADNYLMSHGIDATYNSLSRADKMLVMYNMLLKGTTTDQEDLARSAAQPANLLRILGEQAQYAGRMLGAALFPVLTPLIVLFYNLMKAIQAAAQALNSFLSFVFGSWYTAASDGWNSFLNNLNKGGAAAEEMEDAMDGIAGGAGGAADAAKELKKQLMGFDEINNITPDVDTGGGGGGGGGGASMPDMDIGIWEKMAEGMKNVRDEIMKFANNAIPGLLDVGAEFVSGFGQGFIDVFKAIGAGLAVVLSAINKFVEFLRDSLGEEAFDDLVNGLGRIIGTVAGLTVFHAIVEKIKGLIEGIVKSKFGTSLAKMVGEVAGAFKTLPAVFSAASASGGVAKATFLTFGSAFGNIGKTILSLLGPVGAVLAIIGLLAEGFMYCYENSEPFREDIDALVAKFTEFADSISGFVESALQYLSDAFANFGVSIPVEPLDMLCAVFTVLATVVETVAEVIIGVLGGIIGFIALVVGTIANFINEIISFFTGMDESGTSESESMKTSVLGAFEGLGIDVPAMLEQLVQNVVNWFKEMYQSIESEVHFIWFVITSEFGKIVDNVTEALSGLFDAITSPFVEAYNKVEEIVGWLKDLLSGSISFPHINLPHFSVNGGQLPWGIGGSGYPPSISVSWYAKGGIATKASLAGIGEAGDEGIIPLQGARMKPFALAISDNINKFGAENVSQSDKEMLNASLAQSALLREQNNLLRQILAKDNSVSIDGREIINSINRQQRVQGRQLIGV